MFLSFQLLRKLSFNEEPDCTTNPKFQRNDYVQQNNQRPTKRMMHSDSPQLNHHMSTDETTLDENLSSNDDDDNGNSFSPHGQRLKANRSLRKCLQTIKDKDIFQKHTENRRKHPPTTFEEEDIIFTENKIYIGITEHNLKQYQTSNKFEDKRPFTANYYRENLNNNGAYAKKCNRKLNFNEINDQPIRNHHNYNNDEILFEKVKYDKSKKYLQTSPSPSTSSGNSSLLLEQYLDRNAAGSNRPSPWRYNIYADKEDANGNYRLQDNRYDSWLDNKKQYILHPIQRHNDCHKMSIIDNHEIHYENVSNSRRTSISTTETWIDDELYDNSFNEELEKRCTIPL